MARKRSPAPAKHTQPLVEALRRLDPTGPRGFEGLLRDLLSVVTGQHFRLLKSGHQGGIDVASERLGNGLAVGLEGKRYGDETALPLDELKSKLVDATQSYPGLDLWVLATTREISATDEKALAELGEQHGIAVAVLDWPSSPVGLPRLGLLCAASPDTIRAHIGDNPGVADWLASLKQRDGFDAELTRLTEHLTRPDIGYAAASRRLADWLRRSFADEGTARANLDTFANLLDPSVNRICRVAVETALDSWWADRRCQPVVLLGEEGVGKTWAPLLWWHERAGPEGGELPLTLVIPARHVDTSDPETLLARALARRTGLRTEEFWGRRLHLWLRDPEPGRAPKLLVIIDGLNQNWMFRDWSGLLQAFFANEWQGQVAVILTCRPDHWRDQLKGLPNLRPSVDAPICVGRFDDGELDELLSLYNLRRSNFSDGLISLMRVPRLFRMAVKWRDALQESGDITQERLVYEDWKDRLSIQGEQLVGDDECREFVARLGQRLRDHLETAPSEEWAITRQQVVAELGRDSGAAREDLITTISELVDGIWLEPTGRPHRFRLHKELAPFALGLALVADLKSVGSEAGLADRLAQFFDPLQGQAFGVDILRAATTVAAVEPHCATPVRRCLIEAWLTSQNFRSEDFEAFWRLIGTDPDLFLDVTEKFWLGQGRGTHEDEVLIKAFANAYACPHVADHVHRRAVEWMGQYWPDPDAGRFLGYDPSTERAETNRRTTAERRREWDAIGPRLDPPPPLRCVEEGDASWFAHRAVGVLSFLPRLPFVPAVTAWAVSRAIMGCARHFEEIAWLLRWNPHDAQQTEAAILQQADRLLALGHPMMTEAARGVLEALATPGAAARAERLPKPEPLRWPPWPDTVRVDQAAGSIHWDHQRAWEWPRSKATPLDATMGFAALAVDPGLTLPQDSTAVLRDLASATSPENLWARRDATSQDSGLNIAREALARWAPDALCGLIRRTFDTVEGRSLEGVWGLALALPEHLLILTDEQHRPLVDAADAIEAGHDRDSDVDHTARMYLRPARLAERQAAEQIAALAALPDDRLLLHHHWSVLDAPTRDDLEAIARHLVPDAPKGQLTRWLGYLSVVPLTAMPEGFPACRAWSSIRTPMCGAWCSRLSGDQAIMPSWPRWPRVAGATPKA